MIAAVDLDGQSVEAVVEAWMGRQRGALVDLDRPVT